MTVLLTMSKTVKRLNSKGILIKRIQSVEKLASVNQLITEHKGVLTPDKLHVTKMWNGEHHDIGHPDLCTSFFDDDQNNELLLQNLACNTDGTIDSADVKEQALI